MNPVPSKIPVVRNEMSYQLEICGYSFESLPLVITVPFIEFKEISVQFYHFPINFLNSRTELI